MEIRFSLCPYKVLFHLEIYDLVATEKTLLFRFKNMLSLTIIPRALMGSESIAHEAEGRMRY